MASRVPGERQTIRGSQSLDRLKEAGICNWLAAGGGAINLLHGNILCPWGTGVRAFCLRTLENNFRNLHPLTHY